MTDMPNAVLPAPGPGRSVLHVFIVADGSGSMLGERMAALNWAAKLAVPAMAEAARDYPDVDVMVRVLRFADGVEWPVHVPTRAADLTWPNLAAGGESSMGAALRAVAEAFAAEPAAGRLAPVVVLLSDGLPTDDVRAGLEALAETELGRRAIRIPIAIGPEADLDLLQDFIGDRALAPLTASNAETLIARFEWAAASGVEASASGGGTDRLPPAPTVPDAEAGNLLW